MPSRKADTEGPNGMREQVGIQAIGTKPRKSVVVYLSRGTNCVLI